MNKKGDDSYKGATNTTCRHRLSLGFTLLRMHPNFTTLSTRPSSLPLQVGPDRYDPWRLEELADHFLMMAKFEAAKCAFNGEEALKLQALASGEGPPELAEADLLDLLLAFPSVSPSLPGLLKSLDRLEQNEGHDED